MEKKTLRRHDDDDDAQQAHPLQAYPVELLQDHAEEVSMDRFSQICLGGKLWIAIALDKTVEDDRSLRFFGQTIHGVCPNPAFYDQQW